MIWNRSYFRNDNNNTGLLVLSQDLLNGVRQANNCTAHYATYDVRVSTEGHSIAVQVTNMTMGGPVIANDGTFFSEYVNAALALLQVIVMAGPFGATSVLPTGEDSILADSGVFVVTPSGNHTWSDNQTNILTSYMQNISISLLSGNVYYGSSVSAPPNILYTGSTCYLTWNTYMYTPVRLLSAYSVAVALTILVIALGCALVLRNGSEGMIVASHIVLSASNAQLSTSGSIEGHMRVQLGRGAQGNLIPSPVALMIEDAPQSKAIKTPAKSSSSSGWASSKGGILKHHFLSSGDQMVMFSIAALCCVVVNHLYFQFLDGRDLNRPSRLLSRISDQSFVSYIGIALTFLVQSSLGTVLSTSSAQLFWRTLRAREHTVSQLDALMRTKNNPFSLSLFRCGQASLTMIIASLISSAMPLASVFVPGSIKLSFNQSQYRDCVVKTPRNLTSLESSVDADYSTPINTVLFTGTYLSPNISCDVDAGAPCNFILDFLGSGLSRSDITASSNYTAFAESDTALDGTILCNVWICSMVSDPASLRLSLQAWDMQRSVYQAVECTGVLRAFSILISASESPSTIEVIDSRITSSIPANVSSFGVLVGDVNFVQEYLFTAMLMLQGGLYLDPDGIVGGTSSNAILFSMPTSFSSGFVDDYKPGNISWQPNLTKTLEEYAENVTLSILSGKIYALQNTEGSELLEDFTTVCNYTVTAYEYSPSRLFATYGVAIFLTILCVIGGFHAIRKNGIDESMDFSRFLRAALNERMFNVRERLDMNSIIKADDSEEGSFAPFIDSKI